MCSCRKRRNGEEGVFIAANPFAGEKGFSSWLA